MESEADTATKGRVWQRTRQCLDAGQWRTVAGMAFVIVSLHLIGFFLLFVVVAPQHFTLGASGTFTVGVGITAYTLGMRHAFDADHIAAIDNTTRKLVNDGRRPLSVGFFFSLGHSTVVFVLAFLFAFGIRALSGQVENANSAPQTTTTTWIGTGVSATFLFVIAAINVVILVGILRVFRQMRRGTYDDEQLERQLANRGLMSRIFGRFTNSISSPLQMYPVGVLFGLGFDTATEIVLLFLAAGAAGAGLPFYAILCLPVLFAAGMTSLDTLCGSAMNFAYNWALTKPVRRIFYNLTITALSIFVALAIGSIEVIGLLSERLGLTGSLWNSIAGLDLNTIGFVVAGVFLLTWVAALAIWHFGRIEERWPARPNTSESPP